MKKITRYIKAEITVIAKNLTDEEAQDILETKQDAVEAVTEALKGAYDADDVRVAIKDFIKD